MINISPVRFASINNIFAQPKIKQNGLQADVFVRSANTSFKGNTPNNESFADWAARTDYVHKDFPRTFFSSKDNIIGSGFSHTTYKIPGTDKYILRGPNDNTVKTFAKDFDFSQTTLQDVEDKNLKINIGQPVGLVIAKTRIGIPVFFDILQKQEGKSIGVPPYSALSDEFGNLRADEQPYEAAERKTKYAESLEKVANMPVESYATLISEVEEAAKAGYKLDHLNSNNILLDEKSNRFNLIDMDRIPNEVNYGDILYALTNYCYYSTYQSDYSETNVPKPLKDQATNNTIKIIQKYMLAMKQKGVKFDRNNVSFEFDKLLNSRPMVMLNQSTDRADRWNYFEKNQVA